MPPLYNPEIDALLELIQQTGQIPQAQAPVVPSTNQFRIGQGEWQNLDERSIGQSYSEQFPGGGSFTTLPAGQAGLFGGPEGILGIKQPDPQMVARGRAIQQQEQFHGFLRTPMGQQLMANITKLDPGIQSQILGRLTGGAIGPQDSRGQREMGTFQAKERFKAGLRREGEQIKAAAKTVSEERGFIWVNPKTGEELAPDTPLEEARKTGQRLTPGQSKDMINAISALTTVKDYTRLLKELKLPEGVSLGRGLSLKFARTPLGQGQEKTLARRYAALQARLTPITRAFGADSRVAEGERQRLEAAVPGDFDNRESAEGVLRDLGMAIETVIKFSKVPIPPELAQTLAEIKQEGL